MRRRGPGTSGPSPGHPACTASGSGGFVLLELILALSIIGLLATLALPYARPFEGPARMWTKAQEIAVLLRQDRDDALRQNRPVSTHVDLAERRVRSGHANGTVAIPDAFLLRAALNPSGGIRFLPDGSASGGEIFLGDRAGAALVSVQVDGLTSAVTVLRGARDGG